MNQECRDRWLALCAGAGLNGVRQWTVIESAYGAPERAYHNLNHILDCLARLDEFANLAAEPFCVEMAIWFHDIVYDTHASDNEEQSAEAAWEFLGNSPAAKTVSRLILATAHRTEPTDQDSKLICDIDLSILGSEPQAYRAYAEAVRREYSWVAAADFRAGRRRVIKGFLR